MTRFDGFRETLLADHCIDDRGRLVLREDYEAIQECREAMRQERERRGRTIDALTFAAIGMLVAVAVIVIGGAR